MINKFYFIIVFFFVSCSEIDENEVESSAEDLIDWTSIDLTNDFVVGNFDEKGINKTKLQAELDNISDFFKLLPNSLHPTNFSFLSNNFVISFSKNIFASK